MLGKEIDLRGILQAESFVRSLTTDGAPSEVIGVKNMNGKTSGARTCIGVLILMCFMVLATSAELVSATEVYNEDDYSVPA